MLYIVLMEPENSGNIGACARVMKNFGFSNLVLINPKVEIDKVAIARSKHGKDVLRKAKLSDKKFLSTMDKIIGTTAKIGTDYNINRSPLRPDQLAKRISLKQKTALLIGREGIGLTNEELDKCDMVAAIPANSKYPTLNISHALGIILYELTETKDQFSRIVSADRKEIDTINTLLNESVDRLDYSDNRKRVLKSIWKRVIGKSALTKREVFSLMGYFKKR